MGFNPYKKNKFLKIQNRFYFVYKEVVGCQWKHSSKIIKYSPD